ncbi:MAG: sigma-70 family RNA polymerase sigma factor [Phycisphaerales bacterium]|nr:sigma-70 family RNA polymerase sigma factor [Phycisphaerales bacterium]
MGGEHVDVRGSTLAGPDDETLVRRLAAGRREAFDALVERYQRRATAVANRLVGNLHDALEVVQEAFIRAYRNIGSLEDPARFGSWLLRIVTNLALNYRRDRAVGGPRISLSDCILDGDESGEQRLRDGAEDPPGAEIAAGELSERLERAIAALPPQQRAALVLFSIESLPQKEVAEMLDCSVEAVKWHVFQARKKLKEQLADYF